MCGSASSGPGYSVVQGAPLTYQNGQWVQSGQPVNPAASSGAQSGLSGFLNSILGGSSQPSVPAAPANPNPSGGVTPTPTNLNPGSGGWNPNTPAASMQPASILSTMARGMQAPAGMPSQNMAGQGSMPVTPAGAPMGGSGAGGMNIAALIKALLAKGV